MKKAVKLFESFGVYTRAELESRAEIEFESYMKAVAIEARTMLDMAGKLYIPAVIKYTGMIAHSLNEVKAVFLFFGFLIKHSVLC